MDSVNTYWSDRAALEWQVELGADEAIGDTPVNRYEVPETLKKPAAAPKAVTVEVPLTKPAETAKVDVVAEARKLAAAASDVAGLRGALDDFNFCDAKRAARNTVFSEGDSEARVLVVGEMPDRDADRAGKPFAGAAEQLLHRMFDAIGLSTSSEDAAMGLYLASPVPWRFPALPQSADLDMLKPFLERHIELTSADVIVLMGNTACQMLLGRAGVSRLRGQWADVLGRPALPMLHPAALMQSPSAKREAWADLLALQAKLRGKS